MPADLTDDNLATIAALLRETIERDRYPLAPRVRSLRAGRGVVLSQSAKPH